MSNKTYIKHLKRRGLLLPSDSKITAKDRELALKAAANRKKLAEAKALRGQKRTAMALALARHRS